LTRRSCGRRSTTVEEVEVEEEVLVLVEEVVMVVTVVVKMIVLSALMLPLLLRSGATAKEEEAQVEEARNVQPTVLSSPLRTPCFRGQIFSFDCTSSSIALAYLIVKLTKNERHILNYRSAIVSAPGGA
jgi:hypothetical protein